MKFKWTLLIFILSAIINGVLYAEFGKITIWYSLACAVLVVVVFMGEVGR